MTNQRSHIRNIAIVAHVDHGKTTLVDKLFRHAGALKENFMNKALFLALLLSFSGVKAVENQYFSLSKSAQKWLKNEKTQKYIKRNREQILAILNQDNREGSIKISYKPFAVTAYEREELDTVLDDMTEVIFENARWNVARNFNYEEEFNKALIDLFKVRDDIEDVDCASECNVYGKIFQPIKDSYQSIDEFQEIHDQARDAGIAEACTHLVALLKVFKKVE